MKSHMKVSSAAAGMLKAKNALRSNPNCYRYLRPDDSFSNLEEKNTLHPHLIEGLSDCNYQLMTSLQREAIDSGILQGKHMILRGANGTGKTLAYLLPILNNLYNVQSEDPLGSYSL